LLEKLARLELSGEVDNWLVDFVKVEVLAALSTHHRRQMSRPVSLNGPQLVQRHNVDNAVDLNVVAPGNELVKFADDTYVVVPVSNIHTRQTEIDSVEQ